MADESVPETVLETSIEDASAAQAETDHAAHNEADRVMSTPMPEADEIVDAADLDTSSEQTPAFEQTPFEETPDVGKAVADLANQVNEGTPAEAQFEAPKDPVPPQRDESAMRASTITSFATSSLGMPTGGMGHGAVISGPATKPENEPAAPSSPEPVNEATPIPEPEAPLAPVAPTEETLDSVWKPGQTLSLSGLAPDDEDEDEDVMLTPETSQPASSPFTAPQPPVPPAAPQTIQDSDGPVAPAPTPEPAQTQPAEQETTPADASSEDDTEEQASDAQSPKRFNPWV